MTLEIFMMGGGSNQASGLAWRRAVLAAAVGLGLGVAAGEPSAEGREEAPVTGGKDGAESLTLPGLKIDLKNKWVDVDAKLCLEAGLLELVACRPDSKEHESIVMVDAKAAHIHAGLLLLGAEPGNPAMRRPVDEERTRWIDLPPRGSEVEVLLVFDDASGEPGEHPIQQFMVRGREYDADPDVEEEIERFPTSTFLFAGSHLYQEGEGPPKYLADESGNVISISTFGDELLCLPGIHSQMNGALVWEIDATKLPAAGTAVTLRLKPRLKAAPEEDPEQAPETLENPAAAAPTDG